MNLELRNPLLQTLFFIFSLFAFYFVVIFACSYTEFMSDFTQDYLSAIALSKGLSIYGNDIINLGIKLLGVEEHDNWHPPFVSLLVLPYASLSYQSATTIHQFVCIVLYILLLYQSLKMCTLERYFIYTLPFAFCWYPFVSHLGLAQISIFVCVLLFASYQSYMNNRKHKAAFYLALASSIKLYPLYVLIVFVAKRDIKTFAYSIFYVVLLFIVTFFLVGKEDTLLYFTERIAYNSFQSGEAPFNVSLYSVCMYIFAKTKWSTPLISFSHWKIIYVVLGLLMSTPFYIAYRRRIKSSLTYILAIVTMLILSPILWMHMLIVLLPVLVFLYREQQLRVYLYLSVALTSFPLIEVSRSIVGAYTLGTIPWYAGVLSKYPLLGLLILYACCVFLFYKNLTDIETV